MRGEDRTEEVMRGKERKGKGNGEDRRADQRIRGDEKTRVEERSGDMDIGGE